MKNSAKKIIVGVIIVAAAALFAFFILRDTVENFSDKYAGADLTRDVAGMEREGTYTGYLLAHEDAAYPGQDVDIDLFEYSDAAGVEACENYEGEAKVLLTESGSTVTWQVEVPETGFYNLYMEYLAPESRGVPAERSVYLNGELPFDGANNITFSRIWTDGGEVKVDNQGNEIRPVQVESFQWQSAYFRDDMGYETEPYLFYLEKGTNELTLVGENEPLALRRLTLRAVTDTPSYEEYLAAQPSGSSVTGYSQIIQGEDSTFRSESSLYAKYDRSSPTTQPNSVTTTVLNYVGGDAWRSSGQWIEWDFEVPQDGFYNIMVKGRQNYSRGVVSSRSVYIDGQIPFAEMKEIAFEYSNDWNCMVLGDGAGNPYQFYLTAGKHTIRLEATLGGVGAILEELEDSTFRLNQIYRRVLVYTGATPDQYRDYFIERNYPEVMEAMDLESKRLFKIVDDMVAYSGQKADNIASAQTVAQQLERFCEKPQKITLEFTTFKDNITSLGTAALNLSETKLDIDYIEVCSTDVKPEADRAGAFSKLWHEMKSFAASFVVDYNAVGDVYDEKSGEDVVKVWILTGRDQGTILKSMVDDTFTPETGVKSWIPAPCSTR